MKPMMVLIVMPMVMELSIDRSQYRDEDPDQTTGRFAGDKLSKIKSLNCDQKHPDIPSGKFEFQRTNVGLLEISNSGYVLANDGGFEQNDEQSTYGTDPGPSPMTSEILIMTG